MGSEPTLAWRNRAASAAGNALLTSCAAWISFSTSSVVGLREGYWAAISAIVVTQTELQQTEFSGRDRFIGTAIGALIAWRCALVWQERPWIFAVAVALAVFLCWMANLSGAGRLAAVTVSVIVLIPQEQAIWRVALMRFLEVSWGIAVAIIVALAASKAWRFATRA